MLLVETGKESDYGLVPLKAKALADGTVTG